MRKTQEQKEEKLAKKYEKISALQQKKYQKQQDIKFTRETAQRDRSMTA